MSYKGPGHVATCVFPGWYELGGVPLSRVRPVADGAPPMQSTARSRTRAGLLRQRDGSEQITNNPETGLGITTKIADNTFGTVLPRVEHVDLVACLHRMIKAGVRLTSLFTTW